MSFYQYRNREIVKELFELYKIYCKWELCRRISEIVEWDVIIENLEYSWDFDAISRNPNITLDIIENNPSWKWHWEEVSKNPNLTLSFVKKHLDKEWSWYEISKNPGINWDDILNNPNEKWSYFSISKNPNITLQIIRDNPNFNWNYILLSRNQNITFEFILENLDKDWDWMQITRRFGNITTVSKFPDLDWSWNELSTNSSINFDFVMKNFNKDWSWNELSKNPGIKWQDILDNRELFEWHNALINPNLTLEIYKKLPSCQKNLVIFLKNPNLTFKDIEKTFENVEFFWDWKKLLENPSITYEDILQIKHLLSKTANYEMILEKKLDFYNSFKNPSRTFEIRTVRTWLAARKIKKWWISFN